MSLYPPTHEQPLPFPLAFVLCQPSNSDLWTLIPFVLKPELAWFMSSHQFWSPSPQGRCLLFLHVSKICYRRNNNDASYSTKVQSLWKYKLSTCLCSSYKLLMSLECFPIAIKTLSVKLLYSAIEILFLNKSYTSSINITTKNCTNNSKISKGPAKKCFLSSLVYSAC